MAALAAAPADAPESLLHADARAYCDSLEAGGRKNWRLPTRAELKSLYDRRIAVGGFVGARVENDPLAYLDWLAPEPAWGGGRYWSSEAGEGQAWTLDFFTGEAVQLPTSDHPLVGRARVRCVR